MQIRSCRKCNTRDLTILHHVFFMKLYEKIPCLKGKEDIFENSEFTSYCKIVSTSGKFLQVRLIIIIKRESIDF